MNRLLGIIYFYTLITRTNAFLKNIGKTILDNSNRQTYKEWWADPRIHTLGNFGLTGHFHASVAPFITKHIDDVSYEGENIRQTVAKTLKTYKPNPSSILDLGCGSGMSTEALHSEFFDVAAVAGIDTSPMMLNVAKERTNGLINKPYYFINKAHNLSLEDNSIDISTCMFTFHETPLHGIRKILREMDRITTSGGVIAIVDISPEYKPSFLMELGEPYIQSYLSNIDKTIYKFAMKTNKNLDRIVLVKHHVILWVLFDDVNL